MTEDAYERLAAQHDDLGKKIEAMEALNAADHSAIHERMDIFLTRQLWSAASLLLAVIALIISAFVSVNSLGEKMTTARLEDVRLQVKTGTTQLGIVAKVADLELEIRDVREEVVSDLKEHEQSRHEK